MTREEAIRVLKEGGITLKECEEAFDMAIEALKQEPCDDAINRQAVLDMWKKESCGNRCRDRYRCSETYCDFKLFQNKLGHLPSVNPQPDISEDGTLTVHVKDGSKVSRVLVCGDNHWGGLYYPEQESESGEWLIGDDLYEHGICSKCGYEADESAVYCRRNYDYCYKCGAKMESEVDDNDDPRN